MNCFLVSYLILILKNRDYFYYQYSSLKEFHNPERPRFDYNVEQKALRWAILTQTFCRYLIGIPVFSFFIMIPFPRFLKSVKLAEFCTMPYQIPFLDGDSYLEIAINIIHQLLFGWITYVYILWVASVILTVVSYCFMKSAVIVDLIKEKESLEEISDEEFYIWHAALIDASHDLTEQLDSHYQNFSWCVYLFIKLCYVTMLVLWLSIKIEPELRYIVFCFMPNIAFLFLCVKLVEILKDTVNYC